MQTQNRDEEKVTGSGRGVGRCGGGCRCRSSFISLDGVFIFTKVEKKNEVKDCGQHLLASGFPAGPGRSFREAVMRSSSTQEAD